MKTLNDFKQQVAEKYGFKVFDNNLFESEKIHDEAAELYAEYRAKEVLFDRVWQLEKAEKQGWNEALHWVLENNRFEFGKRGVLDKQSILKGLK